jgi:hypothetical protein
VNAIQRSTDKDKEERMDEMIWRKGRWKVRAISSWAKSRLAASLKCFGDDKNAPKLASLQATAHASLFISLLSDRIATRANRKAGKGELCVHFES